MLTIATYIVGLTSLEPHIDWLYIEVSADKKSLILSKNEVTSLVSLRSKMFYDWLLSGVLQSSAFRWPNEVHHKDAHII